MAVLPDDTALGGLPSANSGRSIATYDPSGFNKGAAAIDAGMSDIGKGISSAAKDISASLNSDQAKTLELQKAQATAQYTSGVVTLNAARDDDTDQTSLKTYPTQHQQTLDDASGIISDPRERQLWVAQRTPDVTRQTVATNDRIFTVQKSEAFASTGQQLLDLQTKGAVAKTDADRSAIIQSGQGLIDHLENAGYITADDAFKRRQAFAQNYAVSTFNALPADQRLALTATPPKTKDEVLDRIGGIENSTGNPAARSPTSSAMGDFQFTNQTWLDTIKAHRPDLMQGRDPQTLLALRADPKVSREMAGYLLDDNAAALKSAGVDASPGNLYLAHFLGADAATKVLKAPPGTPLSDVLPAQVISANSAVLAGKTTGTVSDWSNRKMGAGPASEPNAQGSALLKFMTPDQVIEVKQKAQADFHAGLVDSAHQATAQEAQVKQASDQAEDSIFKDTYSDSPKYTAQDILNNPTLTREARERQFKLKSEAVGGDKADKTYGPGFYDAYQKVHADTSDPSRITDPGQLYSRVGPHGDLTVAGVDKLTQEIQGSRTPEGVAQSEMMKQFLANAKSQITGTDEGLHLKDPKGDELFLKFQAQAFPAFDAGKKAGKTAVQLLNPDSPDYIGKAIAGFKRPPDQWFSDTIHDGSPQTSAFDPKSITSIGDLVSAYRAGKVSKDMADQLAIDKGWAVRKTSAPAGSVAVSQ